MFVTFGRTKQQQWARRAVMALCFLVLTFSFAAKLSLYQPKVTQLKTFVSSKMWQHEAEDAAAVMAAPTEPATSFDPALLNFAFPLLAGAMVFTGISLGVPEWLEGDTSSAIRLRDFVSESQLRAPPIR
jgi:zinc transporter ZupT